jgi:hypothetical protein
VCASTYLTALWFQHSQMKPRFHHLVLKWCDWEIHRHLCDITLRSQSWSNSLCFMRTLEHFWRTHLAQNCGNLVENSAWNLWKFTRKFWNCEASSFTNFLVNTLNKIINQYRWLTTSLFIVNICLPTHLWTFYTTVLQFLHSLHFGCKPLIIHDEFSQLAGHTL